MTTITLQNSKTRKKEQFVPIDPENVRMYLCGPTVYDRAHMGNARNVIMFDVLFRLLQHVYGSAHVTYVRNFTDVDDKINQRAAASGQSISAVTEETIAWYLEDMSALGNLEPNHMPRATEYIAQMITMIEDLIGKGYAYAADGHVLFSVQSDAEYGKLSGRSVDDMIAGARVEVAPYKRDPMDFVLWKPSGKDQPGWDSPWGWGRPGWHIECSAMSHDLLGASFDIHGGGNDLLFPHHENELAQSRCAHPDHGFANYWLHNEMLQVDGKKMSKSLGNFFTVRDLLDQGYAGEVIRFVFLSTHYGKPMDWTDAKAREAEKTLRKWREISAEADSSGAVDAAVVKALSEDLNTSGAITALHALASKGDAAGLRASAGLLGLL
ncbi:MAG: cysteine--tRNA ligase, partial [Marinovum sp.]|nr:cysteine--tRNA ligase [Marinovum sp.]